MAAVQTQDSNSLLHKIIHIIATSSEPIGSVEPTLKMVCEITGAANVIFVLFDEPQSILGIHNSELPLAYDVLKELLSNHPDGSQQHLYMGESDLANWLLLPIRMQNHIAGVLCLMFAVSSDVSTPDQEVLHAAVDGLTIITRNILSQARHEKLGRNQSEFVRIVSHDLRSPLTSMQGFASMLESGLVGELNEKQAHFVEKILSGISQMTSLVDNIQDAGRYDPETGFYEMQRSQCDLMEVVQKIVKNHLVPAEKQELTLSAVFADDIPIIQADTNMLERAIINLVDNAIKYTPNGRAVEVRVDRVNDEIVVSVKDNGLGISEDNQKMLFERHVRIPRKEHKKVKGSGLGLFIVRSIARRHGGDAWVKSVEGEGTTFFISIPLNELNTIVQSQVQA